MKNKNGIAVIIGNRNYEKIDAVKYAINDATLVKRYVRDVLGFRDGNLFFVKEASKEDFELFFGSRDNHVGTLYNTVKRNKSDVFVFYSGHGAPGLKDKKGYFVPVKADPYYIELQGYPRETFYRNLDKLDARSLTVVVDACFSGMKIFKDHSGTVELNKDGYFLKKGILLTSSGLNQASSWYHEKKHGMFTYFFLKAIHDRNVDFNRDGALTFDEMHRFISDETEGAPYHAMRLHGIEQNPTIQGPYKGKVFVRYK